VYAIIERVLDPHAPLRLQRDYQYRNIHYDAWTAGTFSLLSLFL
jgi:hypothetical protein